MSSEITARLEHLERSLRRLRAALVATALIAMLGFGGPWLVGATVEPQAIRAAEFDVVDDSGTTRATIGMDQGAARLALYDETGTKTAYLTEGARMGLTHDGPELYLYDPLRKGGVYVSVGYGAKVELQNEPPNSAVILETEPARFPVTGVTRAHARLTLYDGPKPAASLSTVVGRTALELYNEAGRPCTVIGSGGVGNELLQASHLPPDRPVLVFLDSNGKIQWKAP